MSSRVVGGFDSNRKPSDRLYDRTETWRRSFQPPPSLPGLRSLRFACRLAPVWRDRELNNQSIRYQRLFLHEHKEKKMKRYKRERMKHNFVRFQSLQTDQNISCTFKIKAWVLLVSLHVCPLKHTHTQRPNEDGWDSTHTSPRLPVIDEPERSKVTETPTVCETFSFSLSSSHFLLVEEQNLLRFPSIIRFKKLFACCLSISAEDWTQMILRLLLIK